MGAMSLVEVQLSVHSSVQSRGDRRARSRRVCVEFEDASNRQRHQIRVTRHCDMFSACSISTQAGDVQATLVFLGGLETGV